MDFESAFAETSPLRDQAGAASLFRGQCGGVKNLNSLFSAMERIDPSRKDLNKHEILTTLRVNPHSVVIELTDPNLQNYPFIFLSAPGSVKFTTPEVQALRKYLSNGGFMMADEFFGTIQWDSFYRQLKRVFPEYEPRELSLDHEIFHIVYDFKELPQVTAIHFWQQGYNNHPVPGTEHDHAPHFFGLFDKSGRMMMLICHNNDICDGWEREGEDKEFFERFSIRCSYPLGINIITYAMTH